MTIPSLIELRSVRNLLGEFVINRRLVSNVGFLELSNFKEIFRNFRGAERVVADKNQKQGSSDQLARET